MLIRQPIRNNSTLGNKKPRVFDALIDTKDGAIYLELKNAKQREIVLLCDALWRAMVDQVLIKPDGSMVFRFYGGIEVAS